MVGLFGMIAEKEKYNINAAREDFAKSINNLETIALLNYNDFSAKQEDVINSILKLRDLLVSGIPLEPNEKIELVRLINQAKIKSAALGTPEGYRTFQVLDSISEDIRKYL